MYNEDGHRQTQIRVWSAAELFCRTLEIECLGIAVMSAQNIPEGRKPEDETGAELENVPQGWKRQESSGVTETISKGGKRAEFGEENIEKSKNSKKILTFGHPKANKCLIMRKALEEE